MEQGARNSTQVLGTAARPAPMSMEEMDAHLERGWKAAQARQQKLDPSGGKRKTAEGATFGRFVSYSEIKADLERLYRENARIRAELEAEMAAGSSISSPLISTSPAAAAAAATSAPSPAPAGRRRLVKKSRG